MCVCVYVYVRARVCAFTRVYVCVSSTLEASIVSGAQKSAQYQCDMFV